MVHFGELWFCAQWYFSRNMDQISAKRPSLQSHGQGQWKYENHKSKRKKPVKHGVGFSKVEEKINQGFDGIMAIINGKNCNVQMWLRKLILTTWWEYRVPEKNVYSS